MQFGLPPVVQSEPMQRGLNRARHSCGRSVAFGLVLVGRPLPAYCFQPATEPATSFESGIGLGIVVLERLGTRGTTAGSAARRTSFKPRIRQRSAPGQAAQLLSRLLISGVERAKPVDVQGGYPLFSHEEIAFLAPLISKALTEAEPNQRVKG